MPTAPHLDKSVSTDPCTQSTDSRSRRVGAFRRLSVAATLSALFTLLVLAFGPAAASADAPFVLPGQITDTAGVLGAGQQRDVQEAIDQLYDTHQVKLWVVYVSDFDGQGGASWAERTAKMSTLGNRDALLAVATTERAYYLDVPAALTEVTDGEATSVASNAVEPALREEDWAGAAIAAAGGLSEALSSSGGMSVQTLLIGGSVVVVGAGGVVLYSRKRKNNRIKAGAEAAKNIDPDDVDALAALPLPALDERAKEVLVETDNALRTSQEELDLARGEFGEQATAPFTGAFEKAKATLASAFTVRQRLDDAIPESPEQQRDMLIDIITSCGHADQELDSQVQEFDGLRDLLINAPARLDALTQGVVSVTVRVPESEATLAKLTSEFPASTLASIAENVSMAKERLAYAEQTIEQGRDATALPAGKQGPAVVAIRSAEGALEQARTLLDGVDHAADDIRNAIATLPAAMDDVQAGITAADGFTEQGGDAFAHARAGAEAALAHAREAKDSDPLGSFTQILTADAELDAVLASAQESRQQAERAQQRLDHDLTAAQSQLTAAADFISTRRGAVGAEARTRLAEGQRHLEAAQQVRATDSPRALQHTKVAVDLAVHALRLAQNDVAQWESHQQPRYGGGGGGAAGAVLGGILINSILRGGGGGGGYRGPGSFGGSGSFGRVSRGGGGRF